MEGRGRGLGPKRAKPRSEPSVLTRNHRLRCFYFTRFRKPRKGGLLLCFWSGGRCSGQGPWVASRRRPPPDAPHRRPHRRWKVHEACMLALGSVKAAVTDSVKSGRVHFDMHGFLTRVVLADLNLSGRSP